MTIIGTSHFVSLSAALTYYKATHSDVWPVVFAKLRDGEIHIGPPTIKEGEILITLDNGTRYGIKSCEKSAC